MRPIYNCTQKKVEPTDPIQRPKSTFKTEEIYETIDEEGVSFKPMGLKAITKKEFLDKHTSISPQLAKNTNQTCESFYLPKQHSTILDANNNSVGTTPDLNNTTASGSFLSSSIDTTPLFSPSQILKLNRQRKKKEEEAAEKAAPEYNYQKLSHSKFKRNDLDLINNKELTEAKVEMSKPVEPAKAEVSAPPIAVEEHISSQQQLLESTTTETVNSSTTVFTFKKNNDKQSDNNEKSKESDSSETPKKPASPVKKPASPVKNSTSPVKKPASPTKASIENRFVTSPSHNTINRDSYTSESYSPQYRSTISPRHTVVSRRNNAERVQNALSTYSSMNYSSVFNDSPISLRPTSQQGTYSQVIKDSRENEKRQLGELNDRFAGYVERVRFLEAQNKKLTMELSVLKSKWGSETKQIEQMYKIELDEARSVLNDTAKTKDCVQLVVTKQEADLNNMKKKYTEVEEMMIKEKQRVAYLQEQISANESEISLLKRRLQDLQDEEKRCKQEAVRMMNEIQRVSFELETEMKSRLMLENDKQSLEEELIFLKEIHAKEIEELKHLQFQQQGIDPALFFKNELSHAIKEIREEYEAMNHTQRNEMEGWYRIKVSEIQRKSAAQKALTAADSVSQEQSKRLRQQISDSKRDCIDLKSRNIDLETRIKELEEEIKRESREGSEQVASKDKELEVLKHTLKSVTSEYEELMLSKTDLETEIRTYRKLLEGENERDGLKQIVEGIEKRASNMSMNKASVPNMNRSYTVDTGYSSGAYYKNRKSLPSNYNQHNLSLDSTNCSNGALLNQTMPTKLYTNFAQKFEATCQRTLPNSTKITNKQFILSNPVHTNNNTNLNHSLVNKSTDSFLDNSSVSNVSNSSHYSALFSR